MKIGDKVRVTDANDEYCGKTGVVRKINQVPNVYLPITVTFDNGHDDEDDLEEIIDWKPEVGDVVKVTNAPADSSWDLARNKVGLIEGESGFIQVRLTPEVPGRHKHWHFFKDELTLVEKANGGIPVGTRVKILGTVDQAGKLGTMGTYTKCKAWPYAVDVDGMGGGNPCVFTRNELEILPKEDRPVVLEESDTDEFDEDDELDAIEATYSGHENKVPANHGSLWTSHDIALCVKGYESGRSLDTIAAELKRTPRAIVCRLEAEGKVTKTQREAWEVTGTLIVPRFVPMILYPSGNAEAPSGFPTRQSAMNWFRCRGEITPDGASFSVHEFTGDKVESRVVHRDDIWPTVSVAFSVSGRMEFDGIVVPRGVSFMDQIAAALKTIPGCKGVRVEDLNVSENAPYRRFA
jgi:hypothetical protein